MILEIKSSTVEALFYSLVCSRLNPIEDYYVLEHDIFDSSIVTESDILEFGIADGWHASYRVLNSRVFKLSFEKSNED